MTAADLAAYVGQHGILRVQTGSESIAVPVTILDAREAYGRIDVRVVATDGDDDQPGTWVSADRVKVRRGK